MKCDLLVIGYGNTLRSDDGVGPLVAEAIGTLQLPGVRTLICQQLTPEHAEPISKARAVVFVDATMETQTGVQFRRLSPKNSAQLMAHAADPRTMLALSRDVFGHTPDAWWLTIAGEEFDFGEELSRRTRAGFHEALSVLKFLAGHFCPLESKNWEALLTVDSASVL